MTGTIKPSGAHAEQDEQNGTVTFVLPKQKIRAVRFVNGDRVAHYFPPKRDRDQYATIDCLLHVDGVYHYSKSFRSEKKAIEWCKKESGANHAEA